MKKKEKLQINSIMEVAAKPTYYVAAVIEGMGIEIVNGFAVVGNIEVDLRFENLPPQIRRYKNEQSKKEGKKRLMLAGSAQWQTVILKMY